MKIDILVDVYPHPFKPYLDIQFEEWKRSGHDIKVISISKISGATSPVPVMTLRTIREQPLAVLLKIIVYAIVSPRRLLAVSKHTSGLEKIKAIVLDCQFPRKLPELFFIHNLAAAARFTHIKAHKIPIALYYHGGEISGVASVPPDKAVLALSIPKFIFSNTTYSVNDIVSRGASSSKAKKIPVGFRISDFSQYQTKHCYIDRKFQLISVGRVALEKGFDVAIRAILELKKAGKHDITYTIVGDGPEMRNIRSLINELDLVNEIHLLGRLTNEKAIEQLASADILLLPSIPANTWEENQACVMQEAMLTGAAVVASNTGGVAESIPPPMRKYLFTPGSHLSLAESLDRLLSEGKQEIHNLGNVGRSFVREFYNIEKINQELLSYFERPEEPQLFSGVSDRQNNQQPQE